MRAITNSIRPLSAAHVAHRIRPSSKNTHEPRLRTSPKSNRVDTSPVPSGKYLLKRRCAWVRARITYARNRIRCLLHHSRAVPGYWDCWPGQALERLLQLTPMPKNLAQSSG